MSPVVIAYVILFTVLLAAAAAAVEWGARGRIAARHVWTWAIVLAVIAPPALLTWHAATQRTSGESRSAISGNAPVAILLTSGKAGIIGASRLVSRDAAVRTILPSRRSARETLIQLNGRLDDITLPAWALASLALMGWVGLGVLRWRRVRRSWHRTNVDGVEVDVSAMTGPAVLGFVSQRIVLPVWATEMQPDHRKLILAHETEHISARDPQRLALAAAAIVAMPWNIGLWLCVARLRRAVELDCDARVLRRFPGAKEYGYVLLEVAARSRRSGPLAVPMIALLRLPSELETRLRAMTRSRSASARSIVVGGLLCGVAVVSAFSAPAPAIRPGRALAIARSAARIVSAPAEFISRADTGRSFEEGNPSRSQHVVDSVNALLRAMQENTVRLERAQSDLKVTRVALLSAAKNPSLPASMRARIVAAEPQMWGTPFIVDAAASNSKRGASTTRATVVKLAQIRAQADRAMRNRYPETANDPRRAAEVWFLADASGRVLDARYHGGYPRPLTSGDNLSTQFPHVSPASVDVIATLGNVLGRGNLWVNWVRLKSDSKTTRYTR